MKTRISLDFSAFGDEAEQFAAWLRARGYDAVVGHQTTTLVDGRPEPIGEDPTFINRLWVEYCQS